MGRRLEEYTQEELIEYIRSLKKQKKFGLVWEDKPENVVRECETKLPVTREVEEKQIENAPGEPTNIIIEGDNYHALSVLNYTHAGKIDVIYIDPPYNTGNKDFVYNDCYVDKEDTFRHSKWLSFMSKRLELAKNLLKDDGVIFISIDDNEQATLKLLCDNIFGESNFITKFVWEKTQHFGRQKKNYYSNCEYILCYGKKVASEEGLKELLIEYVKTDFEDAPLYNASNPENVLVFPAGSTSFNIDDGEYIEASDSKYELLDKVVVKDGKNTNDFRLKFKSRWSPSKVINEYNLYGTTYLVKSRNFAIRAVYGAEKLFSESPKQIIFTNPNNSLVTISRFGKKVDTNEIGSWELSSLGINSFSYPKPVSLISYLISLIQNKNIVILDFFAGSGTTGQAVMELNKEDGGHRQFILVTNNEANGKADAGAEGIAEKVTYPRIKTVITGIRPDGSKYSDGIPANLRYFKTDFVEKGKTTDDTREALITECSDMIRMRENAFEFVASAPEYRFYKNDKIFVPIIFDQFAIAETWEKVEELNTNKLPVHCYNFSYNRHANEEEIPEDTKLEWTACSIPETVLEVYRKIFRKKEA